MSLINCPECGKEISDKASACPNCGCPVPIKKKDIPIVTTQTPDTATDFSVDNGPVAEEPEVNPQKGYSFVSNDPSFTSNRKSEEPKTTPIPNNSPEDGNDKYNTFALVAFILGIVSIIVTIVLLSGWIFAIVGIVLGIIALKHKTTKKALAIVGIVLSGITLFMSIIVLAIILVVPSGVSLKDEMQSAIESESETASNVEPQERATVLSDFDYELSGSEIVLDCYNGSDKRLIIDPTYEVDGVMYTTNLMDFQVYSDKVITVIFNDGISDINNAIFNGTDVENVYFPASMSIVYDYTLQYLHPEDGEQIQIYYAGTQEQWNEIFQTYQRQYVDDAIDEGDPENIGNAIAGKVNEVIGAEYDSSLFAYHFSATPNDIQ